MTIETTPRAAWTRCNACQQKVENIRHEIDIHKLICPHRLQLQIQDLAKQLKALKEDVDGLDEQLTGDPDVDPAAVAPWPDDEDDPDDYDDEDEQPLRPASLYSPNPLVQ